jgi:hypothetical protein
MAPRLKTLMASGSKKEPGYTFSFLSKVPANEPPPGSPRGPLWREILVYGASFISLKDLVLSFITVRVPIREPSHKKRAKYLVTVHRAPCGQKAHIQWGVAWFPKGFIHICMSRNYRKLCYLSKNI